MPTGDASGFPPNGDSPSVGAFFAQTDTTVSELALSGFEGDGTPVSDTSAGTIVLPAGTITGGRLAGVLDPSQTSIALSGGGTVLLTNPGATEYVQFFEAAPAGVTPYSGVVGFRTDPAEIPSGGQASYAGAAQATAVDDESFYSLAGDADVRAEFDTARVLVRLTGLTGTRVRGGTPSAVAVDGIVVSDSVLSGGVFSGGVPSVTGAPFALGATADASDSEGAFYGTQADEAAGRIIIRDPGGPDGVTIVGRYTAD